MKKRGSSFLPAYLDGDDVAGAVDDGQAVVQEQLPHVLDVPLVRAAQGLALGAAQNTDRLQRPGQHHGGQRGGEDEARGVGAHGVHQGGATGDVAAHAAEGLACNR